MEENRSVVSHISPSGRGKLTKSRENSQKVPVVSPGPGYKRKHGETLQIM